MNIEVKHIKKAYGKKQVLQDISLTANGGECIGILGSNGCGKSTLLSILAGVQKADSGTFLCDGADLFLNPRRRETLVGYVPQGTPLIEELSAWDNLRLWYEKGALEKSLEDGVLATLGVSEFLRVPVFKMSGGMRKRLSIGCAMAKQPPVLLLDEPTAAQDLVCKARIADYLRSFREKGGILLMTTHDVQELSLCDRHYIMRDGVLERFQYTGNVQELVCKL